MSSEVFLIQEKITEGSSGGIPEYALDLKPIRSQRVSIWKEHFRVHV
jgi:hypothetical protein